MIKVAHRFVHTKKCDSEPDTVRWMVLSSSCLPFTHQSGGGVVHTSRSCSGLCKNSRELHKKTMSTFIGTALINISRTGEGTVSVPTKLLLDVLALGCEQSGTQAGFCLATSFVLQPMLSQSSTAMRANCRPSSPPHSTEAKHPNLDFMTSASCAKKVMKKNACHGCMIEDDICDCRRSDDRFNLLLPF